MNKHDNCILLIAHQLEPVQSWIKTWFADHPFLVLTATNGIDGLLLYQERQPELVFIGCDLPDLDGRTLSTIIKDGKNGKQVKTFLFGANQILENTKADYFFLIPNEESFKNTLHAQVLGYLNEWVMQTQHSQELMDAEEQMYDFLPSSLTAGNFHVTSFFSAYGVLSGDSYSYWLDEEGNLFGFLFDCTDHNIISFSQVRAIRMAIAKELKMFELGISAHLTDVFTQANEDLFVLDREPDPVAAVVFWMDVQKEELTFVPAGIPGFFYQKQGEEKLLTKECSSFLLGFDETSPFEEQKVSLQGLSKFILCSDGFFEVTMHEQDVLSTGVAKHDDVSAILLTRNDTEKE